MVCKRIEVLGVNIFLFAICYSLVSFPAYATSRGIVIKAKTHLGSTKQIRLYSGYHALVIGCADYHAGWPRLPNPVEDAKEVASLLKNMGWSVEVLSNPGGTKLRRELNKLITGPGKNREKAILLWFAGHGQTIKEADGTKLGYLVPVDAPDPDDDILGFMEKAISMRQIETVAKQIMSKHVLMAFDSCFSGAIFQMVRAKPSPYIQEKVSYPVRQFITAGSEYEQVPDKSVFKDVFIQGIRESFADLNRDSYITGEELGAYLQEKVINYSRNAQHPQFGKINNPKLDKGDFVIVKYERDELEFYKNENAKLRRELEELKRLFNEGQLQKQLKETEDTSPVSKQTSDDKSMNLPYKLGILPCILKDKGEQYRYAIFDQINRKIEKNFNFILSKSYYEHNEPYNIKKDDIIIDDVWHSKGMYQKSPNADTISAFGRKLKVDTVLIFYADIYEKPGATYAGDGFVRKMTMYLIDIKTKKVLSTTIKTGSVYEIGSLLKKLMGKYINEILK